MEALIILQVCCADKDGWEVTELGGGGVLSGNQYIMGVGCLSARLGGEGV